MEVHKRKHVGTWVLIHLINLFIEMVFYCLSIWQIDDLYKEGTRVSFTIYLLFYFRALLSQQLTYLCRMRHIPTLSQWSHGVRSYCVPLCLRSLIGFGILIRMGASNTTFTKLFSTATATAERRTRKKSSSRRCAKYLAISGWTSFAGKSPITTPLMMMAKRKRLQPLLQFWLTSFL